MTYRYRLHDFLIESDDLHSFTLTRDGTTRDFVGSLAEAIREARRLATGVTVPLATDPAPPVTCCDE